MTESLLDAINLGAQLLSEQGIEQPRLDAEVLLSHLLNVERVDLYLQHDKPLTRKELSDYLTILNQRAVRTPIQYLTNRADFFSGRFVVEQGVFIPRRDTEVLVEEVISQLKEEVDLKIVDIGTGCGNIAISLAVHLESSTVYATDISPTALSLARRNAQRHGVSDRVRFLEGDLFAPISPLGESLDLVVSNPPYVSKQDFQNLPPEVRAEPVFTYDGGEDGLVFIGRIVDDGMEYLSSNGMIALEIGRDQGEAARLLLQNRGYDEIRLIHDLAGNERVVTARRREC